MCPTCLSWSDYLNQTYEKKGNLSTFGREKGKLNLATLAELINNRPKDLATRQKD
jgi:hypothetical protein